VIILFSTLKKSLIYLCLLWLCACSLLRARPDVDLTQQERFAFFQDERAPIKKPVHIHWDQHSIPFIEASEDSDLAFAVGAVHAHLRLAQLELLRLASQGRLSEVAGPFSVVENVDQFLRTMNFPLAAQNSRAVISDEAWQWVVAFTNGINWYIEQMPRPPVEYQVLGTKPRPFEPMEIVTIGKLIGVDLTWAIYLKYIKLQENSHWQEIYQQELKKLEGAQATAPIRNPIEIINLIKNFSKSGSNSVVVSGQKSQSGSGLIASDPHVGLFLPNFWILMGMKSPSYHALGLMIPGVPFIGVGRNAQIAWGGTNMRAISSHLYLLDKEDETSLQQAKSQLSRRWWFSKDMNLRHSSMGPIINDLPYFEPKSQPGPIAMDWLGWRGSDELTAFLKVMRAKNWSQFRSAFSDYQIPAMNMLYADRKGEIGMVPAYGQPVLKKTEETLNLIKTKDNPIVGVLRPTEQETPHNPESGFIASANNKPFENPPIPYSLSYASNQRFLRMKELIAPRAKVDVNLLKQLQLDIYSDQSYQLKQTWFAFAQDLQLSPELQPAYEELKQWDGHYHAQSKGAALFELIVYHAWQQRLAEVDERSWRKRYLSQQSEPGELLSPWFKTLSQEKLRESFVKWLELAHKDWLNRPTWGDLHVQTQMSPMGFLPLVGSRFRRQTYPLSGGNNTLNKAGRRLSNQQEQVTYGASARHISDLSDLDNNFFVLNGGQDGWLFNQNIDDQTKLWQAGQYLQIPLSEEGVRQHFKAFKQKISPQN
jgi:penicillin G amidase